MVHIIIIAHTIIANSFLSCITSIIAKPISNLTAISVSNYDNQTTVINNCKAELSKLNTCVLILSDIFGATPSNVAKLFVTPDKVELITGLNLPMLLRAVSYSGSNLRECVNKTLNGAVAGIMHITDTQ